MFLEECVFHGVDEGDPGSLDDVLADADGVPHACGVVALDADARLGRSAVQGFQDPDLEVDEGDVADRGVEAFKCLAEREVERVDRAVAFRRCELGDAADAELDRGLGDYAVVRAALVDDDAEALQREVGRPQVHDLVHQHDERSLGGFVFVSGALPALELLKPGISEAGIPEVDAEFRGFQREGLAAGELGDEDAAAVADGFRTDVFERGGILGDGVDMEPRLVRESAFADVRSVGVRAHVCLLADEVADVLQHGEMAGRKAAEIRLEFEIRDDGAEVGVAATLPDAVDGALHEAGAASDGNDGVRHGRAGVVMAVDAEDDVFGEERADLLRDLEDFDGEQSSVRVADRDGRCAAFACGGQNLFRIGAVFVPCVEEVLGVEDDFTSGVGEVAAGFADHRQVVVLGDVQDLTNLRGGRLADDGAHGRAGVDEGAKLGVIFRGEVFAAGAPERAKFRVPEFEGCRFAEKVEIARIGRRPAAFYVRHAEFVQFPGNAELVVLGERDVFPLGAVAERGVVDQDVFVRHGVFSL